jgi:beta-mannosidase
MARIFGGTDRRALPFATSWEMTCEGATITAHVPGTAASAMRAARQWSFDTPRSFDANDYTWRARFAGERVERGRAILKMGGIATLAEVSLNGEAVLASNNMFHVHEVDVTALLRDENELVIRCRALDAELRVRRPRSRWRAGIVAEQQLRWFRTTLLGRMPA